MKVKRLKEILCSVDDDADVLLYDGLDEGDVFCTLVAQVDAEHYIGYCKDDSCTEYDCDATKFLVLAGFGSTYEETLDQHNDGDYLYRISNGPEAEPSRMASVKAREERRLRVESERAARMQALTEERKRRYCVNWNEHTGLISEANFNTMEEVSEKIATLDKTQCNISVFDRVAQKVVLCHEAQKG